MLNKGNFLLKVSDTFHLYQEGNFISISCSNGKRIKNIQITEN